MNDYQNQILFDSQNEIISELRAKNAQLKQQLNEAKMHLSNERTLTVRRSKAEELARALDGCLRLLMVPDHIWDGQHDAEMQRHTRTLDQWELTP